MLHIRDGDRKAQPLTRQQFHAGHTNHLALQVEERPATVARIDLRGGLDEGDPAEIPVPGTDDALRDRPLEPQWVANREALVPLAEIVVASQVCDLELEIFLYGNLQQREVEERVERDDCHVVNPPPHKLPGFVLLKNRGRDPRLLLDHVVVRHAEAPLVQQKARAQSAGGLHQHDPLAKLLRQFLHRPGGQIGVAVDLALLDRRGGRCGIARSCPAFHLPRRDADDLHANIHHQFRWALLQNLPLQLLPGFQLNHVPPTRPGGQAAQAHGQQRDPGSTLQEELKHGRIFRPG